MENIKIGDWYVNTTHSEPRKTMLMTKDKLAYAKIYPHNYGSHLQPWIPKKSEWCWFWNYGDSVPILAKYLLSEECLKLTIVKKASPKYFVVTGRGYGDSSFAFCEPFIGELPSFLKA